MKNDVSNKSAEIKFKIRRFRLGRRDREEYKKMIESNKPAFDWGVVEYEGITYFIDYVA